MRRVGGGWSAARNPLSGGKSSDRLQGTGLSEVGAVLDVKASGQSSKLLSDEVPQIPVSWLMALGAPWSLHWPRKLHSWTIS